MGVNILPRFAAIVSRTITGISFSIYPTIVKRVMVKGTKVISDTSFVMSIELKKQRLTITNVNPLVDFIRPDIVTPNFLNTPNFLTPATISIKQNKRLNTRKSMYCKYCTLGTTKKEDKTARITAVHSTTSFFI